jgi:hypothetical protein
MYDKVKFWIAKTSTTPDVSNYLTEAKEQTDLKTGEVCCFGCLDGLKISIYASGISIIGSLAKYLYPNNIYPLDRHTTVQAVEKLSDNLHISINSAKVSGLEFGTQFLMAHPVENYLSKLGDMPKLLRYHFDVGTLYYKPKGKQQAKVLAFYDKKADAAAKSMILPKGFDKANLLKYEMRLNGRLPQQLGVSEITASILSEKSFYERVMQRYQENYFAISKKNQVKTDAMNDIKTVSDAFDVLVARLINNDSQTQIEDFMKELKEAKVFEDRKGYSRLKKKIQDVSTKAGITVSDELIKELNDEIKNVGAYI